ncbi:MAG TPA: ABC transporter permease [Bauldia sp.]
MSVSSEAASSNAAMARRPAIQLRFAAIWIALVALLLVGGIIAPRSLLPNSILATIPFAAFLAITAAGEALTLISRSIDLSIPAIITLSSTMLLGFSGGSDDAILIGIVAALVFATLVGLINGFLVAVLKLNALIVTLAVAGITAGATLWYRESLPQEARVPPLLADWGSSRYLGLNVSVWVAVLLIAMLTFVLRKTTIGRRFVAVGANPRSAWIAGLSVTGYQITAFGAAGFLYGVTGILLSAFIRNPTLNVGDPYLLAPIAAAVLGGTAISGGIGSLIAVGGAALFLTHLGQMLKMLGLASSLQFIIQGLAIALGMALAEFRLARLKTFRSILPVGIGWRLNARSGVFLALIALALVVWWTRANANSWNEWLFTYQILITGLLLLGGGVLAYAGLTRRGAAMRAAAGERRAVADIAARAALPAALDAIRLHAVNSGRALLAILPENGLQQKISDRLDGSLALPEGAARALQGAIQTADRRNAAQLAIFVGALQFQQTRLRPLLDPTHPLWRAEVLQRIGDALELHAGATALATYAHGLDDHVDLELSNRHLVTALNECRIQRNSDLDWMLSNWTTARSIYKAHLQLA